MLSLALVLSVAGGHQQDGGVSPLAAGPAAPCTNSRPCPLAPGAEHVSAHFPSFFLLWALGEIESFLSC